MIGWQKRDRLGRPMHPWEVVTLDQLEPQARLLIIKQARLAARDFFEEQREEAAEERRIEREALSIDVGRRVQEALAPLANFPRQSGATPEDRCES